MYVCVCVACGMQRTIPVTFFGHSTAFYLRQGLSLACNSPTRLVWLAASLRHLSQSWDYERATKLSFFFFKWVVGIEHRSLRT